MNGVGNVKREGGVKGGESKQKKKKTEKKKKGDDGRAVDQNAACRCSVKPYCLRLETYSFLVTACLPIFNLHSSIFNLHYKLLVKFPLFFLA